MADNKLICMRRDEMESITFYYDNEVVLNIDPDNVIGFVESLKALVDDAEGRAAEGYWIPWDSVDVVKAALGIEGQPARLPFLQEDTWWGLWEKREVPADDPLPE